MCLYSYIFVYVYMYVHMFVVVNFDAPAQARGFESKGEELSSSAECRIRTEGLWNRLVGAKPLSEPMLEYC